MTRLVRAPIILFAALCADSVVMVHSSWPRRENRPQNQLVAGRERRKLGCGGGLPLTFDWRLLTEDPNDYATRQAVRRSLDALTRYYPDRDHRDFLREIVAGRRVLNVGAAAHQYERSLKGMWIHGLIAERASYCLGVDILADAVSKLAADSHNIRAVDATSDADLGERFDIVYCGDVIEHVDNPKRLLQFAARHLSPEGRIIVRTPNPFSRHFIFGWFRREQAIVVNLDHVCWVTPSNALELAIRAGIVLTGIHYVRKINRVKYFLRRFSRMPESFNYHSQIFEFSARSAQD
jgi:2-polyprenyl-3-methyl-5-hydroxy-6-metoxy-1,4-benzoquinol methylase